MYVGNAVILGTFKGNLYSSGTVKILEHGEFYGEISCHRFLIKRGGIFDGTIHIRYDRKVDTHPVKNYNQLIVK
jgi:cytoskeletal protein CcmA (bactofilin family)